MAGLGRKVFTAGDVLTASDVQNYLMDQTVMNFAGTAARSSAIAIPTEGMFAVTTNDDKLDYYNGSSWVSALPVGAWTSYTPTTAGITLGNGTLTAKFCTSGKRIEGYVRVALGSTSAITGGLTFTLPVAPATNCAPLMSALFEDTGTAGYSGLPYYDAAVSKVFIFALGTAGPYGLGSTLSSTIPFTWVSGDFINFAFSYESV